MAKIKLHYFLHISIKVVMITGDNPLTACHVARELHFTKKRHTVILMNSNGDWKWKSIDGSVEIALGLDNVSKKKELWKEHALCVTGEVYY